MKAIFVERVFPAGQIARAAVIASLFPFFSGIAMAAPEGSIVIAQPLLIQNHDPVTQVSASDFLPHTMLFDGLVNIGPKGVYPALATDWKVDNQKLTIDFNLRKGVKFHNGDEFTAEDVKFTFDSILAPGNVHNRRSTIMTALKSVEVTGRHSVRLHLKRPWADMFTNSRAGGTQQIVPRNYYEKVGAKGFQRIPVGTGPFKIAEIKDGESTRFEAFAEYWDGAPNVRFVTQRLVAEPFTRYAMLERREADIAMGLAGPLLTRSMKNPDVRVSYAKNAGTSVLIFNRVTNPEFNDQRVRSAIMHGIDRQTIAKSVLGGVCEPATHHFTPDTFGYNPNIKGVPYDPQKAKALLKEAGIAPGHKVGFSSHTQSFGSLPNAPAVLEAIVGYIEALGLQVTRYPVETGAQLAMMRSGKQPSIFYGPSSVPDDGGSLVETWYTSRAWCKGPCTVNVPYYEEVADKTNRETDPKARARMLQEWAETESQRLEMMPLFWCSEPFAYGKRIADWKPAVGSPYHLNLQSVVIAK